ncbi:very short patch repair endonuclease [Kocuria sp. M1N1S27]|uniref:very short patch repair endonuclease n=1 Tax=Kocuria kalidii TaxID=3376283 RepID=UPI0037BA714E
MADLESKVGGVPPFPVGAASSEAVTSRMKRQLARDTNPELLLRRHLHRSGLRYRVDAPLPGMPRRRADVLFTRWKVAVFVDGCFWHCCPVHGVAPKANAEWWSTKLGRNVQRDRETDASLRAQGWQVLRFWEHEDMHVAAQSVQAVIFERRTQIRPQA